MQVIKRRAKQVACAAVVLMLLAACSTVKLDEAAPVEDRAGKGVPATTQMPTNPNVVPSGSASSSKSNSSSDSSKSANSTSTSSSNKIGRAHV